jgi:hypothetical protein
MVQNSFRVFSGPYILRNNFIRVKMISLSLFSKSRCPLLYVVLSEGPNKRNVRNTAIGVPFSISTVVDLTDEHCAISGATIFLPCYLEYASAC